MIQWEYHIVDLLGSTISLPQLNHLGEQGWELIAVNNRTFYFKRMRETCDSLPQIDDQVWQVKPNSFRRLTAMQQAAKNALEE